MFAVALVLGFGCARGASQPVVRREAVTSMVGASVPIAGVAALPAIAGAGAAAGAGGTQPPVSGAQGAAGMELTGGAGVVAPPMAGSAGAPASGAGGVSAGGGGAGAAGMPSDAGSGDAGSGGAASTTSAGCGKTGTQTGTYDAMVMSSGRSRTFTVTAPTGYDPQVPHRLIVGFHGRDLDGRRMREYLDLERYSDGKVIFVYPWAEENEGYVGWKLGSFTNRLGGEDDLTFFDDMLASLRESHCIDSSRVFVTGQGWGGDMTQLVTCMRGAEVRAGIGVTINGTYYMPSSAAMCTGKPDIFTLHGVDDDDIPLSRGEAMRDFWIREHDCQTTTTAIQPDGCVEFMDCTARTVWCPYGPDNGGHQIPDWYSKTAMDWLLAY